MESWQSPQVPRVEQAEGAAGSRLRIHDTVTEQLVESGPATGTARMYVCGITPYDATHLGHANTYLTFDLVNRVWRDLGLNVQYAQNITDVDEPLLERADQTGVDWTDLALSQIDLFREDMAALRVLAPDHYIGAIECVPCVVALLESMKADGTIYQVEDAQYPDWYFDTATDPGLGRVGHLSGQAELDKFVAMGGDPERPGKRTALDPLVWRQHRPGEPHWPASLGEGRPGWHIECTAIALKYLGPDFDIQGGGSDLAFPHHDMCASQALVAAREPLAAAFVHSGMVALDGEKMSKSKGNLELVSRLRLAGADPMAIRLALINHHYRDDWEWTADQLDRAVERLELWRLAAGRELTAPVAPLVDTVRALLRANLDTPGAIHAIDQWARATLAGGEQASQSQGGQPFAVLVDALLGIAL